MVSFSRIVELADREPSSFASEVFGTIPRVSSLVSDSRAPEFSVDPYTLTLFSIVLPMRKKSFTLSGCAIHGWDLPLNWSQPFDWSYVSGCTRFLVTGSRTNTHPLVRPSSLGPQDSSAPSLMPAPRPFT